MSAYRDLADCVLCEEEGVRLTATALALPDGTVFPLEAGAPSTVAVEREWLRPGILLLGACLLVVVAANSSGRDGLSLPFVLGLVLAGLAPWAFKRPYRLVLANGGRTFVHAFQSPTAAERMMATLRHMLPAPAPAPAPAAAPKARPVLHMASVHPPAPRQSLGSLNLAAKHRIHPSSAADSGGYARVLSEKAEAQIQGDDDDEDDVPASNRAGKR
jgi:hypothetical protein